MINQCDGSEIGVCGGSLLYFSLTLSREINEKHAYSKVVLWSLDWSPIHACDLRNTYHRNLFDPSE